ncbi:MAG: hypothetical protein FD163_2500 [Hyphomonadaceae bacterium]|nr:MAG: hypothetical protein FD128_1684 [Hyphomonadaceae bacterium]KAF0182710.1 MAG: hypothetical protein FD163_2500 [Hyphomonadaceae bacterium]
MTNNSPGRPPILIQVQELADFLLENPHIAEVERKFGKDKSIRVRRISDAKTENSFNGDLTKL